MAVLGELSTASSTKEPGKQPLAFLLASPALLDGGRAGSHPAIPASLLAPWSTFSPVAAAGGRHTDKPGVAEWHRAPLVSHSLGGQQGTQGTEGTPHVGQG